MTLRPELIRDLAARPARSLATAAFGHAAWLPLDLRGVFGTARGLARVAAGAGASALAETAARPRPAAAAAPTGGAGGPRRRIPDHDIVVIGKQRSGPAVTTRPVVSSVPAAGGRLSGAWRILLLALALVYVALGAAHVGRRLAAPKTIVVPATLDESTAIT